MASTEQPESKTSTSGDPAATPSQIAGQPSSSTTSASHTGETPVQSTAQAHHPEQSSSIAASTGQAAPTQSTEAALPQSTEAAPHTEPGQETDPAPDAAGQVLEAAPDDVRSEFTDEAFSDVASTTASLTSSIYNYRYQHGRRFNAYKPDTYFMPNDNEELQRMDLQYNAMSLVFDEKLHLAPLKDPKRILDCGTGTGFWAIEMGDAYPDAEKIIGLDLSPIQETWTPPNVSFQIDDVEEPWTFPPNYFDYVHTRLLLSGSIKDFKKLYQQAYDHLAPGGWFETWEFNTYPSSDDYDFPEDDSAQEWARLIRQAVSMMEGRTLSLDKDAMKRQMEEVGFEDVKVVVRKTPIGDWTADPKLRRAGLYQLAAMLSGLESISIYGFTKILGWSMEEYQVMMAKARNGFNNRGAHMYWPTYVHYGRKPE